MNFWNGFFRGLITMFLWVFLLISLLIGFGLLLNSSWGCSKEWAEKNHCDALCGTGVEQANVIFPEEWVDRYICECPDGKYIYAEKTCM